MAMAYHKVFKVPVWIVLNKMSKARSKHVLEWFLEAGARLQDWPGNSFPKALLGYREKGYAHALPDYPFVIETALLTRAAAEHVKSVLSPTSYLAGSVSTPSNRINRKVENDSDVSTVFNDLISLEDPIAFSQMFQVAEIAHREDIKTYKVWVTPGPAPKNLLTRIADRVITVGDEPNNDVPVGELDKDQINQALTESLKEFVVNT